MPLDPKHQGTAYGPFVYQVGLEKMREFAAAVVGGVPSHGFAQPPEDLHPWLHDSQAADASPYGSVIAFPTFCVVFAIKPFAAAVNDPALAIDLRRLVHGEQALEMTRPLVPGDVLTTRGVIAEISEKAGKDFLVVETESRDAGGERVVSGTWTAVIRR
ncbi:MAG TPA: MaoC family dehydratase N-terminal domain-containing protein [Myxococcaceae bacterium]|nr:MaoC family dehydratase N-terminal domain-containing protein [Myxococcaceae bacterium]